MPVHSIPIGPLETNCHIVSHNAQCVVVDVGGAPDPVWEYIRAQQLAVQAILVTHLHFDHLYGVAELAALSKAPVYAPAGDAELLHSEVGGGGVWGFPKVPPFDYSPLTSGLTPEEMRFGDLRCLCLHTPGHTKGSISFYFPDEGCVCAGDVLFYRSVGRSDLPGGDAPILLRSIREQLFTLPDATVVYPGHGMETSIGAEKQHNPYCGAFVRE